MGKILAVTQTVGCTYLPMKHKQNGVTSYSPFPEEMVRIGSITMATKGS